MEKDKDGFYYVDCGGFGHNSRIHTEVEGIDVMVAKGVITQEVAHPVKKSYPGSDGARIPISLEDHSPECSEKPRRHVHKAEDVRKDDRETQLYLDHFLGRHRRSPYLYGKDSPANLIDKKIADEASVGRGLLGINDTSGLEDQMIMYCTAIDHGSFDHKLSRSSADRAKVLRLIKSARGNVIKYIGRTSRGVVFMTTYKNTTIAELIQNPMRAYLLLGRRLSSNYRLDEIVKRPTLGGKVLFDHHCNKAIVRAVDISNQQ